MKMKKGFLAVVAMAVLILGMAAASEAALISFEDFETGASGWNNNTVTDGGVNFTNFLGRFDCPGTGQSVYKTYTLSGTQTEVTVSLYIYEIDSWDNENFVIFADDIQIASFYFQHGRDDGSASLEKIFTGDNGVMNYGFSHWPDQGYRYTFTHATTAASFKLGFGDAIGQGIADESWGVDNI
ncbi:MAG: hypothetical protein SV487_01530, partial [Thermodesulfobacteriota bacterium]|nr:hypothetical protein [Thermodesulfobacteriota bacterium]